MVWRRRFKILFIFLLLLSAGSTFGQEEPAAVKQLEQAPPPKMTLEDWQDETENINYGEREAPEKKKEEKEKEPSSSDSSDADFDPPFDWSFGLNKTLASIILGAIILTIVILIIYLFVKQMKYNDMQVKPITDENTYSLEEIEENLPETDLERYLRLALESEDYKAAVRIYYLAIIQGLSKENHMVWHREKTNYDYLMELTGNRFFTVFSKLTLTFEIVWYGDAEVTKQAYDALAPAFSSTLKTITDGSE